MRAAWGSPRHPGIHSNQTLRRHPTRSVGDGQAGGCDWFSSVSIYHHMCFHCTTAHTRELHLVSRAICHSRARRRTRCRQVACTSRASTSPHTGAAPLCSASARARREARASATDGRSLPHTHGVERRARRADIQSRNRVTLRRKHPPPLTLGSKYFQPPPICHYAFGFGPPRLYPTSLLHSVTEVEAARVCMQRGASARRAAKFSCVLQARPTWSTASATTTRRALGMKTNTTRKTGRATSTIMKLTTRQGGA